MRNALMPHDWSSAHLQEAFSDYKMFERIKDEAGVEDAHRVYFLLKMSEKAALSYLTDGSYPPPKDHRSLPHFFTDAKKDPLLRRRIEKKFKHHRFVKKIEKNENYARELHRLVSVNQQSANCEYPWADPNGTIHVPSEMSFAVMGPSHASLLRNYLSFFKMLFSANGLLDISQDE